MLCHMQASIPKGDLTLNGGMFQQPPFPLPFLSQTQVKMWQFFQIFFEISQKFPPKKIEYVTKYSLKNFTFVKIFTKKYG